MAREQSESMITMSFLRTKDPHFWLCPNSWLQEWKGRRKLQFFVCHALCRTLHFPNGISCWPPISILGLLLGTLALSLEIRFSHMTCFGQRHVSRRNACSLQDVALTASMPFCTLDFPLPWPCATWWSLLQPRTQSEEDLEESSH